jgi:hypothetical protein
MRLDEGDPTVALALRTGRFRTITVRPVVIDYEAGHCAATRWLGATIAGRTIVDLRSAVGDGRQQLVER